MKAASPTFIIPRLFAITAEDGYNEFLFDKDEAEIKIENEFKKDFPKTHFWVEEVHVTKPNKF